MAVFVLDASATLPWCFEDESTPRTDALLDRLRSDDQCITAAHWPTEVSNGMWMAVRRRRIPSEKLSLFWDALAALPIRVELPLSAEQAKSVLALCQRYELTVYDAAYLELAKRNDLALATLDAALMRAASSEGVTLAL
jgi:predicted nucleic acid-binding protein